MSVRRRSSRLQVLNADGVLRVWWDVTGFRSDASEYLVISDEAAVKGEHLTMYLASDTQRPIPVRVVDSQPMILDGTVQHQLRLSPLEAETFGPLDTARDGDLEAE